MAADSHRRLLALDPDSPDALFNTAQVLTSLAEALAERDSVGTVGPATTAATATPEECLSDAVACLEKCLQIQETQLQQQQDRVTRGADEQADIGEPGDEAPPEGVDASADREDQWFAVLEPLTNSAILDTVNALLDTLATRCDLDGPEQPQTMERIKSIARQLLEDKLPRYSRNVDEDTLMEAWRARAEFSAALLNANFRSGSIDIGAYDAGLKDAFAGPAVAGMKLVSVCVARSNHLELSIVDIAFPVCSRRGAGGFRRVVIASPWARKSALDALDKGWRGPCTSLEVAAGRKLGEHSHRTRRCGPASLTSCGMFRSVGPRHSHEHHN